MANHDQSGYNYATNLGAVGSNHVPQPLTDGKVLGIFKSWDLNGDGTINKEELKGVLQDLCNGRDSDMTRERIDKLVKAFDTDGTGRVEYHEFVRWIFGGNDTEELQKLEIEAFVALNELRREVRMARSTILEQQAEISHLQTELRSVGIEAEVRTLTFLHFNDVYDVHPRVKGKEPVGGAARMKTLIAEHCEAEERTIVTFGGDFVSPSILSSITKGKHMVEVFNEMGVEFGVLGNHEFDFGMEKLTKRLGESKSCWLMSNVIDTATGKPPCGVERTKLVTKNGIKVGMMGLVEDWIGVLSNVPHGQLKYLDFIEVGNSVEKELREEGAQVVIALTHCCSHAERRLAKHCQGIDLLLGGHDHFCDYFQDGRVTACKSGVDFRHLSEIVVTVQPATGQVRVQWPIVQIPATSDIPEHPVVSMLIHRFDEEADAKMNKVIGALSASPPCSSLEALVRTRECPLGNWTADVMRLELRADCAFINGGAIRGSCTFKAGPLRKRDIYKIFPFNGGIVSMIITGRNLKGLLENSVCKCPAPTGRYPHVSNIRFEYACAAEPGSRVTNIFINGEPIGMDKSYVLATNTFLAKGKEGAVMLPDLERVVDEEYCRQTQNVFIDYCKKLSRSNTEISLPQVGVGPLARVVCLDAPATEP